MSKIKAIYGHEPRRDGEYPSGYTVGYGGEKKVARIEPREQNLGTYDILWFDVFSDDGALMASANALAVSEIHYDTESAS